MGSGTAIGFGPRTLRGRDRFARTLEGWKNCQIRRSGRPRYDLLLSRGLTNGAEDRRNSMAANRKVIITCAVTGSIHTPTMTPHLPITAQEIADAAVGAAEAGAAIVHLHARDPKNGQPTPDPERFMAFLPVIKQSADVVVNITTGGGHGMSLEERLAAARRAKPEMCSLNMG